MFAYANQSFWPFKAVLVAATVLAVLLGLFMPQNSTLENVLNTTFPSTLDSRIRLVAIDEDTLQHYGRTETWSRDFHALALQTLQSADAKVIGVDLLFADPSNSDQSLAETLQNNRDRIVLATSPDLVNSEHINSWGVSTGVSALNPSTEGVREYQTGYLSTNGEMHPSLTSKMAQLGGSGSAINTKPQLLRYVSESKMQPITLSFRQLLDDNVQYRELQNKWVIIGVNAKGVGSTFNDINGEQVSGLALQARALNSLLTNPFWRMPVWLTVVLCVTMAVAVIMLRGLWGYALAFVPLLLSVILWQIDIVFPAVTISLAAIVASSLLALENWWVSRRQETHDPLTGVYSRLAFTRAMEQRWPSHLERPLGLLLIELDDFQNIYEQQGHVAGDNALRQLAHQILKLKRRSDMLFRWGPAEFALLLDNTTPSEIKSLSDRYQNQLSNLYNQQHQLTTTIGTASTSQDVQTPSDLMSAASNNCKRLRFEKQQRN